MLWSVAEADALLICCCIPYIQETLQGLWGSTTENVGEDKSIPRASSADVSSANLRRSDKVCGSSDYMRAQDESYTIHEGELVMISAALSPTPRERVDWSAREPTPNNPRGIETKSFGCILPGSRRFRRSLPRVDHKGEW